MKKAWESIKNFKWGYLLFAVLFFGSGLLFIMFPEGSMKWVRTAVGVTAMVFAFFTMAMTLANRERSFRFWAKMITSVLGIVCGGFIVFADGEAVFRYLVFVLGLYMIIDGSFKLQTAILSKRYRFWLWWVLLVCVMAGLTLGVILMKSEFDFAEKLETAARLVGFGFIVDGLLNLLSIVFLYQIEHGQREEVVRDLAERGLLKETEPATDGAAEGKPDAHEQGSDEEAINAEKDAKEIPLARETETDA